MYLVDHPACRPHTAQRRCDPPHQSTRVLRAMAECPSDNLEENASPEIRGKRVTVFVHILS